MSNHTTRLRELERRVDALTDSLSAILQVLPVSAFGQENASVVFDDEGAVEEVINEKILSRTQMRRLAEYCACSDNYECAGPSCITVYREVLCTFLDPDEPACDEFLRELSKSCTWNLPGVSARTVRTILTLDCNVIYVAAYNAMLSVERDRK